MKNKFLLALILILLVSGCGKKNQELVCKLESENYQLTITSFFENNVMYKQDWQTVTTFNNAEEAKQEYETNKEFYSERVGFNMVKLENEKLYTGYIIMADEDDTSKKKNYDEVKKELELHYNCD